MSHKHLRVLLQLYRVLHIYFTALLNGFAGKGALVNIPYYYLLYYTSFVHYYYYVTYGMAKNTIPIPV